MMFYRHGLSGLGAFDVSACIDGGDTVASCQEQAATAAAFQAVDTRQGAVAAGSASSGDSSWVTAAKAGGALLPGVLTAFGIGPAPKPGGPIMLAPPTPWYMTLPGIAVIAGAAFVGYKLFVK